MQLITVGGMLTLTYTRPICLSLCSQANTGGCTKQGQCYRDEYSSWQALGFSVYGLSNDNPIPLKNWKEVSKAAGDKPETKAGALTSNLPPPFRNILFHTHSSRIHSANSSVL